MKDERRSIISIIIKLITEERLLSTIGFFFAMSGSISIRYQHSS